MSAMTFEEVSKKCIEMIYDMTSEWYDLDSSLEDDIGLDSLDKVELLMDAEDVFNIDLPESELNERVDTIRDFAMLVLSKL